MAYKSSSKRLNIWQYYLKAPSVVLLIGATCNYELAQNIFKIEHQFNSLMLILQPIKIGCAKQVPMFVNNFEQYLPHIVIDVRTVALSK